MVSKFVLSNLLLATAALARLALRQQNHQPQPVNSVASSTRAAPNVDQNAYQAGAVVAPFNGQNGSFTTVTGTFAVPTFSSVDGSNSTSGFSIWVGINRLPDKTCPGTVQVGIDARIIDGAPSYNAWYESFTESGITSLQIIVSGIGISINASDVLTVSIKGTTVTIENHTKPQTINREVVHLSCGNDVEWIVGVNKENSTLPLANFGDVIFTNAQATASAIGRSANYSPLDATTILDIVEKQGRNETLFTFVNTADDSLLVQYLSGN